MKRSFVTIVVGGFALLIVMYIAQVLQSVNQNQVNVATEMMDVDTPLPVPTGTGTTTTELVQSVVVKQECIVIDDFSGASDLSWFVVNDGVMGGLSAGMVSVADGLLVHSGVLNTNGGGFSYAGTRFAADTLVGYNSLRVRLNTDGRQYAVNFGDARNRRISHQILLPIGLIDDWQEVSIDFADTVSTIFSRPVQSAPFAASAIDELSFILGDAKDGPFQMEIDWIKACL